RHGADHTGDFGTSGLRGLATSSENVSVPSVVFYVSGHGFGHASRETEVIHAFAERRPDWTIVLRTSVSPALLARSLHVPFTLLDGPCDTGIVQRDSVTHDDEATAEAAVVFYASLDER